MVPVMISTIAGYEMPVWGYEPTLKMCLDQLVQTHFRGVNRATLTTLTYPMVKLCVTLFVAPETSVATTRTVWFPAPIVEALKVA
jgi:hypothetical protein